MKQLEENILADIAEVLASQHLAVLSTQRDGQPYSSLMAFAYTPDLATFIVATGSATRKYVNLMGESRVSLLVDSRSNCETDFHVAAAITVIGNATPVPPEKRAQYETLYRRQHPYLKAFVASPTTVLFKIAISHYILVNRFQNVMEYHLTDEKDIFA